MANSPQFPGVWNITVWHGDPYTRTFQFTLDGEPYALPTNPGEWSAAITLEEEGEDSEFAQVILDTSQAGIGRVGIQLPLMPVNTYDWALKPAGIRTLLAGAITVTRRVPL